MAPQKVDWSAIARNRKFVELKRRKAYFLFGWWAFSTIYYLLLPIGAGSAPELFKWKVLGNINFGYVFAMSQFLVSWILVIHYVAWGNKVSDQITDGFLKDLKPKNGARDR